MSERERKKITQARHEKLVRQIEESPLNNPVREVLLLKLKVASVAGYAAVLREFELEMELYRAAHLPSYVPKLKRLTPPPVVRSAPVPSAPPAPPPPPAPPARTTADRPPTQSQVKRGLRCPNLLRRMCRKIFGKGQRDFFSLLSLPARRARASTRK